MTLEIISIGTEILSGYTVNTNAAFMGKQLLLAGFTVERQTVVADEYNILTESFKTALKRSKVVIVTGGLGPTLDDITKNVAADLFNSGYQYDESVAEDLRKRYGDNLATLMNQSTVPSKAIVIKNFVGTAPGFIFQGESSMLILIPGVPQEMESMMLRDVIPFLKKHLIGNHKTYDKSLQIFGLNESAVDPTLRALKEQYPLIEFGIYPSQGKVTVVMTSHQLDEPQALQALDECFNILVSKFQAHYFSTKSGIIEEAILEAFKSRKLFLSVAESCTGGKISAKLVAISGASDYFLGGIVCYSNFLKTKLLSVSEKLLNEEGAVSEHCVSQMATSLIELTGSDYSLAISGIAGPTGGTSEKPVGTVFFAIGFKKIGSLEPEVKVFKLNLKGTRVNILESASNMILFELYKSVTC